MSSASSRGCSRSPSRLPARQAAIRAAAERITPARARRRFRAGDDGPRRDDLHPARSEMPAVPASRAECDGRATGEPARVPGQGRRSAPARAASAPPSGSSATARSGSSAARRKGMLGGMRALPDDGWSARADGSGDAPLPGSWRAGGVVRHGFTHFDLELGVAIYAGDRLARARAVRANGGRSARSSGGPADAVRQGGAAGAGRFERPLRGGKWRRRGIEGKAPGLCRGLLLIRQGPAYRLTWRLVPPAPGPPMRAPSPLETTLTQSASLPL